MSLCVDAIMQGLRRESMTPSLEITFLGTGTSTGVPVIGCLCPICSSQDPRDQRLRCSIYLKTKNHAYLIDAGPDLRQQCLHHHISEVDAVFYTHSHLDHVSGFDELRAFCWSREEGLPFYASPHTLEALERMFPWAFADHQIRGYVRPLPIPFTQQKIQLPELSMTPLLVEHASVPTHGFLIETAHSRVAYFPDVKQFPLHTLDQLHHLDVLILGALRPEPHPTHQSQSEALQIAAQLRPKQTFLTHLSHSQLHQDLANDLPESISPAYDGLTLSIL